jgi:hypothetical protein
MQKHPSVRASAVLDTLAFLDQFEAGSRQRVLAAVPAPSRALIEGTARSAWIGIEHDHYTIDAIIELFGKPRAIAFWAAAVAELTHKPLLKAFVSGMFKLMPLDARRVASIFATGWPLVYRDMCSLEVGSTEGGHPVLRFASLAPAVRRYHNYLHSWHGGCVGFARLARLSSRVSFRAALDASSAEASFVPASSPL